MHIPVAILSVAVLALPAVQAAQDVAMRPRFTVGSQFQLEVTRSKDNPSRQGSNIAFTRTIEVRVVSATRQATVLEWRGLPTFRERLASIADPVTSTAIQVLGGAQFTVLLDADGAFDGIGNAAELGPKLVAARDAIMVKAFDAVPAENRKKADDLITRMLSAPQLVDMATRDAQIYTALNGLELPVGDVVEAPFEQPNPVGGKPLKAMIRVRMESATAAEATASLTITYDAEAVRSMLASLVAEFAPAGTESEMRSAKLSLVEEGQFVFDRKLAAMREVTYARRMTVGQVSQVEKYLIRLVTDKR